VHAVKQRPIRTENDELPSVEELYFALEMERLLHDESGILPEMVKAARCQGEFLNKLLELVHDVWRKAMCQMTGEMLYWFSSLRMVI